MSHVSRENGFMIYDGDSSAPDLWRNESRLRSISKPKVLGTPRLLQALASTLTELKRLHSENPSCAIQLQCKITFGRYLNPERLIIYGTTESSTSEISEISELMPESIKIPS